MIRLKKDIFLKIICAIVGVLFVVRLIWPEVARDSEPQDHVSADSLSCAAGETLSDVGDGVDEEPLQPVAFQEASRDEDFVCDSIRRASASPVALLPVAAVPRLDFSSRHRIYSVSSYRDCFPDVQDVHYPAALVQGVRPVADRLDAERRKQDLLFVGANPYYVIDPSMNRSIPYLVPKASHLLQHIGRRFLDSLAVKQIPLHKIIVTSVLRTEDDVVRLRRINGNTSEQSCHRFGTTFDISYNRYHTVAPPDDPDRRAVRNDSLKFILSEVLRDVRQQGLCYVKYEVKQGCYHITVR